MRGHRTHGFSAKLHKGSGSKGGKGMAGSGKRADQKKTLVLKEYKVYFGRQGFTSRKTKKRKIKFINIQDIETRFKPGEIDLSDYKVLGDGEITNKFIIKANKASVSALEKIKKAGGEIILPKKKQKQEEEVKKEQKKEEKKQEIKKEVKEE